MEAGALTPDVSLLETKMRQIFKEEEGGGGGRWEKGEGGGGGGGEGGEEEVMQCRLDCLSFISG